MPEKKFNWGTLILGIIIGAVVVGVVWAASKPAATGADSRIGTCLSEAMSQNPKCTVVVQPGQNQGDVTRGCVEGILQSCGLRVDLP